MAYTTIKKPSLYFNTKLYTGTGSSGAKGVTGVGFQPDFLWIKNRSAGQEHWVADAVRGTTKFLESDTADAESSDGATGLASFDSDGFTLGTGSNRTNQDGSSMVAWNWKAGSSNTSVSASGSGNNCINACTHRANTTSGFSIVKYTGRSDEISNGQHTKVTHGLGVKPSFYMIKQLGSKSWAVMLGDWNDKHVHLDTTDAADGGLFTGNQNNSDATHIVVGKDNHVNNEGSEYIAYVFADKIGYSKSGSYTGNGNADGTFVYTGFKPAWVMLKRTDVADGWHIFDNKRDVDNVIEHRIEADSHSAEHTTVDWCDLLSNGFKLRYNGGGVNVSGGAHIYIAFAAEPLVGDNPGTAR